MKICHKNLQVIKEVLELTILIIGPINTQYSIGVDNDKFMVYITP